MSSDGLSDWNLLWRTLQRRSWQELKDALSDSIMLAAPVRGRRKVVMTSASAYGLGTALFQLDQEHRWASLSLTSHTLQNTERNNAPTERECLAVVRSLQMGR